MMADIVPMESMSVIDQATLFQQTGSASAPQGTNAAPLGPAYYPTFQSTLPNVASTILGPMGATVPSVLQDSVAPNSGSGITVAASLLTGNGAGELPAATSPKQASSTGLPSGPNTFLPALPSMVKPKQGVTAPAPFCFGQWVTANPALVVLGSVGLFFLLRKREA